jgi:hypothetical protein
MQLVTYELDGNWRAGVIVDVEKIGTLQNPVVRNE